MGARAHAADGPLARAQILEMLEPGVGTVPGHRWGADRAWRRACSRACSPSLFHARDSGLYTSCPGTAPRSAPPPRSHSENLTHTSGGWGVGGGLSLVPPECVPGAGRELSVGEGRAGVADGRRRWGERARERVNKCGAQRARTCGGRGLRVVAGATVPQCPSGSGAGIQCFRCLVCVWGRWVSLTLDVRLKPAGGRSGVGIRKHVEPFSVQVQGGSSPPWRTRLCPLKTSSPLLFRLGGMFQTTPDAAVRSEW